RLIVVVGAERDDEMVRLVLTSVGGDAPGLRVDGRHRFTCEPHAGLRERAVRQAQVVDNRPEKNIELRVAEEERVALLDQRHSGFVAECVGQHRRELETAEACTEYDGPWRHGGLIMTHVLNLVAAAAPPGSAGPGPRQGCVRGWPPCPQSLGRRHEGRAAVAGPRGTAAWPAQPARSGRSNEQARSRPREAARRADGA